MIVSGIVKDSNGLRRITFLRKNCSLWEIRQLRNEITHTSLLSKIYAYPNETYLWLCMEGGKEPRVYNSAIIINPYQYFLVAYKNTISLVKYVRRLIHPKNSKLSSLHDIVNL
jgi:hypothetical protein